MDTQLRVVVIYDCRRTKTKTASLIPKFPDSFGLCFLLSDYIFPQRLGLGFALICSMKFTIFVITTSLMMGFRTQCIPAELAWSGVTDGLE